MQNNYIAQVFSSIFHGICVYVCDAYSTYMFSISRNKFHVKIFIGA